MTKKKKTVKVKQNKPKFFPTEFAKMKGKDKMLYLWHDINLGQISEQEFDNIKI